MYPFGIFKLFIQSSVTYRYVGSWYPPRQHADLKEALFISDKKALFSCRTVTCCNIFLVTILLSINRLYNKILHLIDYLYCHHLFKYSAIQNVIKCSCTGSCLPNLRGINIYSSFSSATGDNSCDMSCATN